MTTTWSITVDCAAPRVLAEFWKTALGYTDAPPPAGFESWTAWFLWCEVPESEWDDGATIVDPDGIRPQLCFLVVPEAKRAKNRLHLDLKVSGGRAEPAEVRTPRIRSTVAALTAAGARTLEEHRMHGELDHVVLADPEGNEFCVV